MHLSLCICALIPRLETKTRLVLVMHKAEKRKPTNTGHLATMSLVNSETIVRGIEGLPEPDVTWPAGTEPVLLYPSEGAKPLEAPPPGAPPITLIVPDGNWRQASKVRLRVKSLRDVRCATLPVGAPTSYRLRTESVPNGLATIEAIARAFGILEGPEVQTTLETIFRTMVERTLWIRGALKTEDVADGIPEGVEKHNPTSGQNAAQNAAQKPAQKPDGVGVRPIRSE